MISYSEISEVYSFWEAQNLTSPEGTSEVLSLEKTMHRAKFRIYATTYERLDVYPISQ